MDFSKFVVKVTIKKEKFMATTARFSEKDIPYDKLAKLGINKDMAQSMPKEISEKLMTGNATPLIMARVRSHNGNVYNIPMRLQMLKGRDGKIKLMTFPVRKEIANDMRLSNEEKTRLGNGETIRKEVIENGHRQMKFIQMDKETKSLIKVNVNKLRTAERLAEMESINNIQLGSNQKEAIRDGKPVELTVGDQKVTVGVDLKGPQGFEVVNGDMEEWKKQKMIRYDLAHEGFMGYILTDKNRWEYQQVVNKDHVKKMQMEVKQEVRRSAAYAR